MATKQRTIQSINSAINLLDILMDNKEPMSMKELAAESGLPKSTISGYLSTMRNRGLIEQNELGHYMLGSRLFEYGFSVYSSWDIIQKIHPIMGEVCTRTKLNCILAVDNHGIIMNVASWSSIDAAIGIAPYIGIMNPFHASAQGKVFLASYSDKAIRRIIEKKKLKKYTETTIISSERLFEEIEGVRKNGYAVNNGEYHNHNKAVSVPVYDSKGNIVYALGVLDDVKKIDDRAVFKIVEVLKEEAAKISVLLQ